MERVTNAFLMDPPEGHRWDVLSIRNAVGETYPGAQVSARYGCRPHLILIHFNRELDAQERQVVEEAIVASAVPVEDGIQN